MDRRLFLVMATSVIALTGSLAFADPATDATTPPASDSEIVIKAHRLDAARQSIQPDTGASTHLLPAQLIEALPGGDNAPMSQIILQLPGVAEDSAGQLHIRGDHNNIQYRIDGVILPEGLSAFGQVISPRFAQNVSLITGALPAEYGLRTAGIIDITTKSGLKPGGEASIYGGSHGTYQPSITYGGSTPTDNYFVSLSYQENQLGIEAPYDTHTPPHDRTTQLIGFGYYDHILNDTSRVSFIVGASDQTFQIPNTPGLTSVADGLGYAVDGVSNYSGNLNSRQHESTQYAVASYLTTTANFTGQASLFARYSKLVYTPDWLGELAFNGISQYASKSDISFGFQSEGALTLNSFHTLRSGLIIQADRSTSYTLSDVLATDDEGAPITETPSQVLDTAAKNSQTYSVYLQDEWQALDHLVLNYGLRFDQLESYREENQLSPRINFVWTPLTNTTVHGGYSRYFTPPPYELVASQTLQKFNNTTAAATSTLDTLPYAERDHYFDLGVSQKLSADLTVGVDSYYRIAKHLIDEGQFGAPIILTPFNYQDGRNQGFELSANYSKGPLTAYANFAVAKAQGRDIVSSQFNFSAEELAYIANHYIYVDHDQTNTASAGVTYKLGETKLALDGILGSGLRVSTAIPNGARLPVYSVVNGSIAQHVAIASLGVFDFRFDIQNMFDEKYEIRNGTGIGVGAPQWGARRGFFFGISRAI